MAEVKKGYFTDQAGRYVVLHTGIKRTVVSYSICNLSFIESDEVLYRCSVSLIEQLEDEGLIFNEE